MKQTDNRETVNVVVKYKGNQHTVSLKMLNPTSTIEFYQLLIPKVNFLLTNKYPEEIINFDEVRHNTPNEIIINRSIAAKSNPPLNNASDFSALLACNTYKNLDEPEVKGNQRCLKLVLNALDENIKILKEFTNLPFQLICFQPSNSDKKLYAYAGDTKPPICYCLELKNIKAVAHKYMDNETYLNWFEEQPQDKDLMKFNVTIEFNGNSHLLLVKVRDAMDDDEFDKTLHAEIEKTLSKEYPNAEFSPEAIPYTVCNNFHLLNSDKQSTPPSLIDEAAFNKEISASVEALLKKKQNTFIEYKGQRHFHIMPTGYDDERNAAICEFISAKYPNDSFSPEDIAWEHCWPIARFDEYIFEKNNKGEFDWAFTQFTNQIEIMVYCSQVEKGVIHNGLIETIIAADAEVEILKQFVTEEESSFHLIAFKSKYTVDTAYAFIGNDFAEPDNEKPEQPIFGCMPKKEAKKIAEHYMDDVTYNDWFGASLRLVN